MVQQQLVAVGFGARRRGLAPSVPPAPPTFSTIDLLAEFLRHGFGDEAGDRVGRAAGREGHDHGDGAFRIGLGQSGGGEQRYGKGGGNAKQGFHGLHQILPMNWPAGVAPPAPVLDVSRGALSAD
jgi:hypothetical protein